MSPTGRRPKIINEWIVNMEKIHLKIILPPKPFYPFYPKELHFTVTLSKFTIHNGYILFVVLEKEAKHACDY